LNSTFHIALFRWAIGEGLADNNPVAGTNLPLIEVARDRVLSDTELASIWRHAGDGDYGAILKLLMLTGQRRDEVASMQWQEIDLEGRLWTLPAARVKREQPRAPGAIQRACYYDFDGIAAAAGQGVCFRRWRTRVFRVFASKSRA
jgi:integrase